MHEFTSLAQWLLMETFFWKERKSILMSTIKDLWAQRLQKTTMQLYSTNWVTQSTVRIKIAFPVRKKEWKVMESKFW